MAILDTRNKRNRAQSSSTQNFGEVLRKTRERHGISLAEISSDLKIREDILVAIEAGDFSKIPPQGYSRNMIKSYARLLGLNTNKITNMFLDAEYSYRLNKKQASAKEIIDQNKKRVPNIPVRKAKTTMTPREQLEQRKIERDNNDEVDPVNKTSSFKHRTMHVYGNKYKNTPRARREQDGQTDIKRGRSSFNEDSTFNRDLLDGGSYSSARERLEARRKAKLQEGSANTAQENPFTSDATKKRKRSGLKSRRSYNRNDSYKLSEEENPNSINNTPKNKSGYQFMNVYHKKNNSNQSSMQIPIITGAVILLLIVLILVFFFVGKQNENSKTDVSNLNVVGISDIEKSENSESDEENIQVNTDEPKEVEFKYSVKSGENVYMEIYENDSNRPVLAREVKSGETNTFKVTGKLKVVTSKPSAVDLYVAGQLVQPVDTKGNGVYTYTVDFNEYLTKWKTQNATKKKNS